MIMSTSKDFDSRQRNLQRQLPLGINTSWKSHIWICSHHYWKAVHSHPPTHTKPSMHTSHLCDRRINNPVHTTGHCRGFFYSINFSCFLPTIEGSHNQNVQVEKSKLIKTTSRLDIRLICEGLQLQPRVSSYYCSPFKSVLICPDLKRDVGNRKMLFRAFIYVVDALLCGCSFTNPPL